MINYIGSKEKIIPYIEKCISDCSTLWDAFSGSCRVGVNFSNEGKNVISSDVSVWSYHIGNCYLMNDNDHNHYTEMINELNALQGIDGWFSQTYGSLEKLPYQIKNLRKLDAIREKIDEWTLTEIEKSTLIVSLLEGLNDVDNTLGHFSSYLRDFSKRSYNDLVLNVPNYRIKQSDNLVVCGDVFGLVDDIKADVMYIDPPYGSNNIKMPSSRVRYSTYYHFLKTVCLNDKPNVFGKVGRRIDTKKDCDISVWENVNNDIVVSAFDELICRAKSNKILISYNSNGKMSLDDIIGVCENHREVKQVFKIPHRKNVMADMKSTNEWNNTNSNEEYLIVIE